jgi:hypothetical protein
MVQVVSFEKISSTLWNDLCLKSDDAWLFHNHEWILFEERYGQIEKNFSFGIFVDESLVAAVPLYEKKYSLGPFEEKLLTTGSPKFTGPMFANELISSGNESLISSIQNIILEKIFNISDNIAADRVHIGIQPLTESYLKSKVIDMPFWLSKKKGFHVGQHYGESGLAPAPFMSTLCVEQIVNLDLTEDKIFAGLSSSCRRAIRKASASNYKVSVIDEATHIDEIEKLTRISSERTGQALLPTTYYENLFSSFVNTENVIIIKLEIEDNVAAILALACYKNKASFLSLASDPDFLEYRVNDLIHWCAIRMLKSKGFSLYRLGPFFPNVPENWSIHKVSKFKTKFGNFPIPLLEGSFFREPAKYINLSIRHMELLLQNYE